MIDLSSEIKYQPTRSGGKGGQNVNKVETAIIGFLDIGQSQLLSEPQKELIRTKLANRLNKDFVLVLKAQTHRTQLANKEEATDRINDLVNAALVRKKFRIATKVSRAAKERRIDHKKRNSETKLGRRKLRPGQD